MPFADLVANAAPPTPEFQRGTGPNQLAYGEATQANQAAQAAMAAGPQGPPAAATAAPSSTPQTAASPAAGAPPPPAQPFKPTEEADKYLFGPTNRPNEPITAGSTAAGHPAPPPELLGWMPYLRQAAELPNASPQVKALFSTLMYLYSRG